jgi:very-short-patch-repair endonuclease
MSDLIDKGANLKTPPLQGRGKGWGLSREQLETLKERAREMRNNPTEPEKRLWRNLSSGQLGGYKFRRQEVIGRAIVDFYCPSQNLIVEVDGETHADPERDRRRDAYLRNFDLSVLHVTNYDVMRNVEGVLTVILQALEVADRPHPNPSPEGEGLVAVEAQKLLGISLEGSVG